MVDKLLNGTAKWRYNFPQLFINTGKNICFSMYHTCEWSVNLFSIKWTNTCAKQSKETIFLFGSDYNSKGYPEFALPNSARVNQYSPLWHILIWVIPECYTHKERSA